MINLTFALWRICQRNTPLAMMRFVLIADPMVINYNYVIPICCFVFEASFFGIYKLVIYISNFVVSISNFAFKVELNHLIVAPETHPKLYTVLHRRLRNFTIGAHQKLFNFNLTQNTSFHFSRSRQTKKFLVITTSINKSRRTHNTYKIRSFNP